MVQANLQEDVKRCFTINSFEEVNLMDPFPPSNDEKKKHSKKSKNHSSLSQNLFYSNSREISRTNSREISRSSSLMDANCITDFVYDESRFREEAPPGMVYVPSKLIMRKIMRVCASVNDFTDLYYIF